VCVWGPARATLFVEIKGAAIERLVLEALAGYDGDVAIHSFDHALIGRLHATRAPYPLGILFEDGDYDVARTMRETGATDVWPHWPDVTPALVAQVHAVGGRVIPWTVNDVAAARRLADLGVDGLCGDDVALYPAG
jgi:glycerophosphoryl diester phosphodiesterase